MPIIGEMLTTASVTLRQEKNVNYRLTVLVHVSFETLSKTTSTALIPVGLVNWTTSFLGTLSLTDVLPIAVYTSFEKSRTTWRDTQNVTTSITYKNLQCKITRGKITICYCLSNSVVSFKNKLYSFLKF